MRINKFSENSFLIFVAVFALAAAFTVAPAQAAWKIDTPSIAPAYWSTAGSVNIEVTAGPTTGAPAGFTIQWKTKAAFEANGWYGACEAYFWGNEMDTRYGLGPGESVIVNIGDQFPDDVSATSLCYPLAPHPPLLSQTEYVFRAFTHSFAGMYDSGFTNALAISTANSDPDDNTEPGSPGGWADEDDWPVDELMLGNHTYTEAQLRRILMTKAWENALIALAHELIAAKLNVYSAGCYGNASAQDLLDQVDAVIGDLLIPPIGTGYLSYVEVWQLILALMDFNNDAEGNGYCAPGHPNIQVTPGIDFGDVLLAELQEAIVTINNIGTEDLEISVLELAGSADITMDSPELPAIVASGGTLDIPVSFSPSAEGAASAVLTITSDDPDTPSETVNLTGNGVVEIIDDPGDGDGDGTGGVDVPGGSPDQSGAAGAAGFAGGGGGGCFISILD